MSYGMAYATIWGMDRTNAVDDKRKDKRMNQETEQEARELQRVREHDAQIVIDWCKATLALDENDEINAVQILASLDNLYRMVNQ